MSGPTAVSYTFSKYSIYLQYQMVYNILEKIILSFLNSEGQLKFSGSTGNNSSKQDCYGNRTTLIYCKNLVVTLTEEQRVLSCWKRSFLNSSR